MLLTDAKILHENLGDAIRDAELAGAETIDLSHAAVQFDDAARAELNRAIVDAKRQPSDD